MNRWRDGTSYSKGDRGKVDPRIWEVALSGKGVGDDLRISVHRMHGVVGVWFGTCYEMGVERRQLKNTDIVAAQAEFLRYLKNRAWSWADRIASAEVP